MATEPISDKILKILGEIVKDTRRDVWIATLPLRRGQSIQIRVIGQEKGLKIAQQLAPGLCDHEEEARFYAAEKLLDLHNAACIEGKPLTKPAFVKRLRLDSAAFVSQGCLMCFKDRLQEWEHTITVFADKQWKLSNASTAPLVQRPESKIHVEPFPPLVLVNGLWEGKARLQLGKGFQSRLGGYGSVSSTKGSDGTAHLSIGAPDKPGKLPPSPEQANGFRYLLEHETAIRDAILRAIMAAYPAMQKQYGYSEEEARQLMPDLQNQSDLKKLIGLSTVHVLTTSKSKLAYLGFEFGCSWDDEHGLGLMTHKNRVVEVGGSDTSFDERIATKDAKRG
jgi:hypothetical protein